MGRLQIPSPEEWLQLLRDAEYVVTNSFHATAFCIVFHKKFFTVVNGEKNKGINVRMYDFLHTIGLEGRMLNSVPDQIDLSDIDYSNTNKTIEKMREESMSFLRRNLEAAYQQKIESEKKEPK